MTDSTFIDIVPVKVDGGGVKLDLWYAHCLKCDWESERVFKEEAARKDKVDHVWKFKCFSTSRGATVPAEDE